MSAIACCVEGCGASVCFSAEVETRLRRTHEFWMCPFGHQQHFTGKSELEKQRDHALNLRDIWCALAEETDESFGTCPFCARRSYAHHSRRWQYLIRHMVKAHPDIIPPRALMAFYKAREERAA